MKMMILYMEWPRWLWIENITWTLKKFCGEFVFTSMKVSSKFICTEDGVSTNLFSLRGIFDREEKGLPEIYIYGCVCVTLQCEESLFKNNNNPVLFIW